MAQVFLPPEGGVGLGPKRGCLLTLAYYTFPRWYEFGERRWDDILTGENRRTRRKTCPSATLSTTNPTWIDPGANPGLRGKIPATSDLSHGTARLRRLVAVFSPWRPWFASRLVHVGFAVDRMTLRQVFLRVIHISSVSMIPPLLHIHPCIIWGMAKGPIKTHFHRNMVCLQRNNKNE
jgi:hypothetical protein